MAFAMIRNMPDVDANKACSKIEDNLYYSAINYVDDFIEVWDNDLDESEIGARYRWALKVSLARLPFLKVLAVGQRRSTRYGAARNGLSCQLPFDVAVHDLMFVTV
jgi:hypothetical protein